MTARRRADYQRLCEELKGSEDESIREEIKDQIIALIAEDEDHARGFFEDSLRRSLGYISPTVGKKQDRPFSLAVEIHHRNTVPVIVLGASFRPKLDDNVVDLSVFLGEEIYGLARLKGFDWLIDTVAVNGNSVAQR